MKRIIFMKLFVLCLLISIIYLFHSNSYARMGDCGYEGGISSGEAGTTTNYNYKEMCFLSGEPIELDGTLNIKKSIKQNSTTKQSYIETVYTYNLKNALNLSTLNRTIILDTYLTDKGTSQEVGQTSIYGTPAEIIKIGNNTYNLTSYSFTGTYLTDLKPAINYFVGNILGKKVYQVIGGTGSAGTTPTTGQIIVDINNSSYGYIQYWSTAETQNINYVINYESQNGNVDEKWGGTINIKLSQGMTRQIKYYQNEPAIISFDGGYVEVQNNNSILEYTSKLPEFTSGGVSTDNIIEKSDSLKIETFPLNRRLFIPNTNQIKGHWSENDVNMLFSLEIFQGNEELFNPEQYISRAEYVEAVVLAAKEVPADPLLASNSTVLTPVNSTGTSTIQSSLPFGDISVDDIYYVSLENAYNRGLISGREDKNFGPNYSIITADAIVILMRTLGLENLAPGPTAVTNFKDNNDIPTYARNSVYIAEKIGLIKGDSFGYFKPNDQLTKARAAALINNFIDYMRTGIRNDYKKRAVSF